MKLTQMIAGALIASLSLTTTPLVAAEHLVPAADLQQELTELDRSRTENRERLTSFFASPEASSALAKSGMNSAEVVRAVESLDDDSLERLTARAFDAEQDLAAGALTNQQLTYIVVALGTAVLILVIIAA